MNNTSINSSSQWGLGLGIASLCITVLLLLESFTTLPILSESGVITIIIIYALVILFSITSLILNNKNKESSSTISSIIIIICWCLLVFSIIGKISQSNINIGFSKPAQQQAVTSTVDPAEKAKSDIAATQTQVNLLFTKASELAGGMDEESNTPTAEQIATKNSIQLKDAWGNDIVIQFIQRKDEYDQFSSWRADVYSKGPDGSAKTADDIKGIK